MRVLSRVGAALVLLLAAWLWLGGGADDIARWAASGQRDTQNALAGALRRVRTGDIAAWGALVALCFGSGVFHAAGPGHGKLVIGGYGFARKVPVLRLTLISLAASLTQAAAAVALVYAGVLLLGWSRDQLVNSAEAWFAPASYGAIALVGLWLGWRGARRLWPRRDTHDHHDHHGHDAHHDHDHGHDHDGHCEACGHRHGPTIEEVIETHSLRDALVLIGAIAIRPCTGAIFVLILTYQMGIAAAGIAGAFAMGLGTAGVTIAVALAATTLRGGLLGQIDGPRAARAMAALELSAGAIIALLATQIALRMI